MPHLFSPLQLRSLTLRNRIAVSPMCMYSCETRDGMPGAWHMVHLGARATGGASIVFTEATAIEPRGRISLEDTGIWDDAQAQAWRPIAEFIISQGAIAGMQLAHAGRKAGTRRPWAGRGPYTEEEFHDAERGPAELWPVGPSSLAFREDMRAPRELTHAELDDKIELWVAAARRALAAGFNLLELHMAHGYLVHEFLSPLTNQRSDEYGGSLENCMRFPLNIARAVRGAWPVELPLFVRISASDWVDGGWDIAGSIEFARQLKLLGIDLIDVSSGGNIANARMPVTSDLEQGYQTPLARKIRSEARIPVGTVGLIRDPIFANQVIEADAADIVLLARSLLHDPYWPWHAAQQLGIEPDWPAQYKWAIGQQ